MRRAIIILVLLAACGCDVVRHWLTTAKGDTLLILHDKRIDEERPGEDAQAGEFILFVELQRRGAEPHANVAFDAPRP